MAFNATTYHMNKHRRNAWLALKKARELRARIRIGDFQDWEKDIMLPQHVRNALFEMKCHLSWRRIRDGENHLKSVLSSLAT